MANHRRKGFESLLHRIEEEVMALAQNEKDNVKAMVLIELEKMFTNVTDKYNSEENHDMMLFLLDVENNLKQALMNIN